MAKWVSVFNGKLFLRFSVLFGCWKIICVSIIVQIIPWKWEAFLGPFHPVYSTVAVARPGTSVVSNTGEEKCRWFAEISYQIVACNADGNFPVNTTQVKQVQLNSAFIRPASSSLLQSACGMGQGKTTTTVEETSIASRGGGDFHTIDDARRLAWGNKSRTLVSLVVFMTKRHYF